MSQRDSAQLDTKMRSLTAHIMRKHTHALGMPVPIHRDVYMHVCDTYTKHIDLHIFYSVFDFVLDFNVKIAFT